MTDFERFWSKVDKSGECWLWIASRLSGGYGQFQMGGRPHAAHRAAWILANGPIPPGLHVLHSCDNPPCVRLDHLRLGTVADNMRDKALRGRYNRNPRKRPDDPPRKHGPFTLKDAGERLNVTPSTLRVQIHKGKLRSVKRGRDHWITEGEIERYRREHQAARSIDAKS